MRKVILFMMVTLDGFFEGPNGDIGWHTVDEEFNNFAIDQLNSVDTLLFGRVTYEGMASYWPTPVAIQNDPEVAGKMNTMPKIVFSRTLDRADWNNTRLIKDHIAEEVTKLKGQPGKDLIIFGSSNLAASFAELGLMDEYRIMVSPTILGEGTSLFDGIHYKLNLKLVSTRSFGNGNVLLVYRPAP
jgi:dihydrofolate reductase